MGKNLSEKFSYVHDLFKQAGVLHKSAQEVTEKKLDSAQPEIGDKMQNETESGTQGNYASDPSVDANIEGQIPSVEKIEGDDDKPADAVLSETGTQVKNMTTNGDPSAAPAQVAKSAALQRRLQACVEAELMKSAALAKEQELAKKASVPENEVVTATSVLNKIASLNEVKTEEEATALLNDIDVDFVKLASSNPLFNVAREQALIRKMANEVEALAAAEGIPPEAAADMLDNAVASDPAAMEELNQEAEGEALSDLASAEDEAAAMMDGLDQTAAQLSEALGEPVTSDDLLMAVDEVVAQADALGVPPEALIQAAAEEMAAEADPNQMAQAEELVNQAAANGVSPEELVAGAAAEATGNDSAPVEEKAAEEKPAEEKPEEQIAKEACLKKLATTRRGANLMKILAEKGK